MCDHGELSPTEFEDWLDKKELEFPSEHMGLLAVYHLRVSREHNPRFMNYAPGYDKEIDVEFARQLYAHYQALMTNRCMISEVGDCYSVH